ncbi:hypothetical protein [Streptomyces sp. Ag109_O5-10]|uniref:hypothetical protein n=1 Tax=Streptomyces sp. Ag109_O5-10 TaxID=1855349 RepID=UPI000B094E7C
MVSVGAALTSLSALLHPAVFTWVISFWLWLTVIFADLAKAVAEGRGKAQAASLRKARTDTVALRLLDWRYGTDARAARTEAAAATELKQPSVGLDRRLPPGPRICALRGGQSGRARTAERVRGSGQHVAPDNARCPKPGTRSPPPVQPNVPPQPPGHVFLMPDQRLPGHS